MKYLMKLESFTDSKTYIKLFEEKYKQGFFWLLPADERFLDAVKSVPELEYIYDSIVDTFLKYNDTIYDFLIKKNCNPNYIFIAVSNLNKYAGWNDITLKSFTRLQLYLDYRGPVGITDEEYQTILMKFDAEKYNIL